VFHGFPAEERYALTQQLRRAAISITANIAEGFGRYSYQENVQFCRLARGSAYEVRDHLFTAYDQRYLATEEHQRLEALARRVIMTLNGYIRSTQARQKAEPRARS
jgi:four helix bundle protein